MAVHSARNIQSNPGDTPATPPTVRTTAAALSQDVPVSQIRPSPTNPRQAFDDAAMAALTASVAEHGVLEPVILLRRPDSTTTYELVAGERRWRAARAAGLERIPARVLLGVDGKHALALQAVENLQRADLNPIEEAQQFRQLAAAGLTQAEIARTVGKSQPYIANRLRILELPADVQDLIRAGTLTAAHGVSLARFSGFPAIASKIAALAAKRATTVKDLDKQKLPFASELEQHHLVRSLWHPGFDPAVCASCPFDAYRKASSTWCLKPDHADQLKAEAQAAAQAAARAKVAESRAKVASGHATIADLPPLDWSRHCDLRTVRPAGCDGACPCASQAVFTAYDGTQTIVPVCTDKARYRALQQAERDAEAEATRQAHQDHLNRALAVLAHSPADTRQLALVVLNAVARIDRSHVIAASTRHTNNRADTPKPASYPAATDPDVTAANTRSWLDTIAQLDTTTLVRFAVEAIVRAELHARYEGYHRTTTLTDWLLSEFQPTEASP